MADTINMRIEGADELMRKLDRMGLNVNRLVEVAAVAGAEIIRNTARGYAPGPEIEHSTMKRTATSASLDIGADKKKWYYNFFESGAGAHAEQGSPLLVFEGGDGTVYTKTVNHPGMAAKPFLRPAFDGEKDHAVDAVGDELRKPIMAECI